MNDVNGYDSTIKYAIMDIVGAINKIESMKQDRYLAMHPYSITHSADGYYRTYLPADDGKRKQDREFCGEFRRSLLFMGTVRRFH